MMADKAEFLFLQATGVAVAGVGVLLRGPSGSGKSDLALRLIDGGAKLIADDGVELSLCDSQLIARLPAQAPESVRGRLEVRGLGIMPVPFVAQATVGLLVDLVAADALERLPPSATVKLLGESVRAIKLVGHEPSAPAKVRLAAGALKRSIIHPS